MPIPNKLLPESRRVAIEAGEPIDGIALFIGESDATEPDWRRAAVAAQRDAVLLEEAIERALAHLSDVDVSILPASDFERVICALRELELAAVPR